MTNRPHIPEDLRRRVLLEAGHGCAIPTCRYIQTEIHHIIPWRKTRTHEYDHLIALCPNCHARADNGEIDRKSLYAYKYNLRFLHDKYSPFEIDFMFELFRNGETGVQLPNFMHLLVKRLTDSKFCLRSASMYGTTVSGMVISPETYVITEIGKEFIRAVQSSEHRF